MHPRICHFLTKAFEDYKTQIALDDLQSNIVEPHFLAPVSKAVPLPPFIISVRSIKAHTLPLFLAHFLLRSPFGFMTSTCSQGLIDSYHLFWCKYFEKHAIMGCSCDLLPSRRG